VPPPPTSALTLAIGTSERHGLNGMQGSCDKNAETLNTAAPAWRRSALCAKRKTEVRANMGDAGEPQG
jgi:hypothetical protein